MNQYIHTRTGEVIELIGTDAEMSRVVTVTATGARIRKRLLKTTSLKRTLHNARGTEWKSAYVEVAVLPEDHPLAPRKETSKPNVPAVSIAIPKLGEMTDVELSEYANLKRTEAEMAKNFAEAAKKEMRSRFTTSGGRIIGSVYVEISANRRFNPDLAASVLTPDEYASILTSVPSSELARDRLTKERYDEVCKVFANKVEMRTASPTDLQNVALDKQMTDENGNNVNVGLYPAELVDSPF